MTKKDYENIALHLRAVFALLDRQYAHYEDRKDIAADCLFAFTQGLASAFAEDNPRFNEKRFVDAVTKE